MVIKNRKETKQLVFGRENKALFLRLFFIKMLKIFKKKNVKYDIYLIHLVSEAVSRKHLLITKMLCTKIIYTLL